LGQLKVGAKEIHGSKRSRTHSRNQYPVGTQQRIEEITMTDKAHKILQKMNKRQALKRLANPKEGTKLLSEMNSLVDDHELFV
jgi:hypothetical protein